MHLNLFQPSRTQKEIYYFRSYHEITASCPPSSSSASLSVPPGRHQAALDNQSLHSCGIMTLQERRYLKTSPKQAWSQPQPTLLAVGGRGDMVAFLGRCCLWHFAAFPTNLGPFMGHEGQFVVTPWFLAANASSGFWMTEVGKEVGWWSDQVTFQAPCWWDAHDEMPVFCRH